MSPRSIVLWPDPRLKTVCEPVEIREGVPLEGDLRALADDMAGMLDSLPGCVGIAAPQLGALVRIVAVDVTGHRRTRSCHGRLVLVNPEITARAGNVKLREGCLSIPDFTGNVRRPERVTVRAWSVDGEPLELHCDAWEARVVQHELDHLDGLLFLDRVNKASDVFPRKEYR